MTIGFTMIDDYKYISEIKRVIIDSIPKIGHKPYHDKNVFESIIKEKDTIIEEKVDGKASVKRNGDKLIFMEWMYYQHTIPYFLSDWNIVYDIGTLEKDGSISFYNRQDKENVCFNCGYEVVPLLHTGSITVPGLLKLIKSKSKYNPQHQIEGVVIKNYRLDFFGKIVNPEFDIDVNWIRKERIKNRLVKNR
jgi:hypothetical protein